jgi:hypothetical protein
MTAKKLWPRMTIAIVIAIGLNVLWAVAASWLYSTWQWNFTADRVGESMYVDVSGTPYVHVEQYGTLYREFYRTLDGKLLPEERRSMLSPALLSTGVYHRSWYQFPLAWAWRIHFANDAHDRQDATLWYLIQDDDQDDRLYLVGYDSNSRLLVGYIGRSGFRPQPPEQEDRFLVGRGVFAGDAKKVAGATLGQYSLGSYYSEDADVPPWALYMLDDNRLVEVDLRARTVRKVIDAAGAISIDLITKAEPPAAGDESQTETSKARPPNANRDDTVDRLAIRYADRIALVAPLTGETLDYTLPKELRTAPNLTVYALAGRELYLWPDQPYSGFYRRHTLFRADANGKVLETTSVELAGSRPERDVIAASKIAVVLPSALAWAVIGTTAGPVGQIQQGRASNYPQAVGVFAARNWTGFLIALLASVAAAAAVLRLARRHYREHDRAWSLVTLLLGPAMLLAYLAVHRSPAAARCASCGRRVPVNRDACAACKNPFPEPAPTGIEVFA